jgi:16S rRNA (cytosine1402-N4)-methyltransferase
MADSSTRRGPRAARAEESRPFGHRPVLLSQVLSHLGPKDGGRYIDGTFGAGGYTRALLEAADCRVVALDRDPAAIEAGAALTTAFPTRLTLLEARFGDLAEVARSKQIDAVDGVALDVGVSSMQLDDAARGFSFHHDGPLDMRMGAAGRSAADLLNELEEKELAQILFRFGEERRSRALASAIVAARREKAITSTGALAKIVARVLGRRMRDGKHPATRTFQALRIAVNDEIGELARGLGAAEHLLRPGGRLVVVTFHSLEDRIVKRFFGERAGRLAGGSRHLPEKSATLAPSFRILNRRPLTPSEEEIAANPRARSAKLRAGERTRAPAWLLDLETLGTTPVDLGR